MVWSHYNVVRNIKHNIRRIKPYIYDTNVEDIKIENMYDNVNI